MRQLWKAFRAKVSRLAEKARVAIKNWWSGVRWYQVVLGLGLAVLIIQFEPLALALAVPVIMTGTPQWDVLLGVGTLWASIAFWVYAREMVFVCLFFACIRVVQVSEQSIKDTLAWHRIKGKWFWLLVPATIIGRLTWDLLGAYGDRILHRVLNFVEVRIRRNAPKDPWVLRRFWNRKQSFGIAIRTKNRAWPKGKIPVVGKAVVELHFTPRKGRNPSRQELILAWKRWKKSGVIPKGYRVHSDIRFKVGDKLWAFAYPKATRKRFLPTSRHQVIQVDAKHGDNLKNQGQRLAKGSVYIASGYGRGISTVVDERPVLVWSGDNGLHLAWGEKRFVLIKSQKGILMFPKAEKLPSFSRIKGRTFDFRDATRDPKLAKMLIEDRNMVMELKYPDHFHVMVIDDKGRIRLFARRPAIRNGKTTNVPVEKTLHVPELSSMRVSKKYHNSVIELGLYLDKDLPAVQAEQLGAAILNSSPAKAVETQKKLGALKAKAYRFRKLNGQETDLDWEEQRRLVEGFSRDTKQNGKLLIHIPKKFSMDAKSRKAILKGLKKRKAEGVVFKERNGKKAFKLKFILTSDVRFAGVESLVDKNGKVHRDQAGAIQLADGSRIAVRYVPIPGAYEDPKASTPKFRRWLAKNASNLQKEGWICEVEHEDTPKGQKLQSGKLIAWRKSS